MMQGLRIKLRRLLLLGALLTFLPACLPTSERVVAPPPPQSNETAKAVCDAWKGSEPSWEDADTEPTKDAIDLSIRRREAICIW